MENIECIFCKKENSHIVIEENGYRGRKCNQCGLIYISPRPSFDEIINLYRHNAASEFTEVNIPREFAGRLHAKHNLKIISSYVKKGTILEIGSGSGYFLDEARRLGFEPYGIEINPIQVKFIRNELRIPCEESPLTRYVFGEKQFDIVYHCDVISHFFDPISEFRKIQEKMKEGGLLIFETGNFGEISQKYFRQIQRFNYPQHLFLFSTNNQIELLDITGFKLVKIYRYSILPQLMVQKIVLRKKDLAAQVNQRDLNAEKNNKKRNISEGTCQLYMTEAIVKNFIKFAWSYFNYFLRYKIGFIVPKACRPQTVIVVARKKIK